jgi:outer membrane protein
LIVKRSAIVLLSAILYSGFAAMASSAELKIGVVNIQKLAGESPQGKAAREALRAEFEPKQKEIETQYAALQARETKLNKDAATMTEVAKAAAEKDLQNGVRELQLKQSNFQEAVNEAQQDANARVGRILDDEVKAFARANGYDLILPEALYAAPALDVTESILQAMSRKAAAAPAAAPAASKPPATPAAK